LTPGWTLQQHALALTAATRGGGAGSYSVRMTANVVALREGEHIIYTIM